MRHFTEDPSERAMDIAEREASQVPHTSYFSVLGQTYEEVLREIHFDNRKTEESR